MPDFICKYCGRDCHNEKEQSYCERHCLAMINIYEEYYKLSFEDAKSKFLMELL